MKQLKKIKTENIAHLAIFHVQQCYGGGEEGGWYFRAGELKSKVHTYFDEDYNPDNGNYGIQALYTLRNRIQRALDHYYEINDRDLSSVLSEGQMRCEIWRGEDIPANYPKQKPHYE